MPVLTCPFKTVKSKEGLVEPGEFTYPKKYSLSTELSIKPTAGESWNVEGLTFNFTTYYVSQYNVNIKVALETLQASKKALEISLALAKEKAINAKEIYEKTPGTGAEIGKKEAYIAYLNASAEEHSLENEIEVINREVQEIGKPALREAIKFPPLSIILRLYARGNEQIWNDSPVPLRFFEPGEFSNPLFRPEDRIYSGHWFENFNGHIEFDDPIDFTERENLKLVIEFSGPPTLVPREGATEGPVVGPLELSPIESSVNYSRTIAGGE